MLRLVPLIFFLKIFVKCFKNSISLCRPSRFSVHPSYLFSLVTGPVPFRTFVMLISLACHLGISTLTDYLFTEEKVNLKFDFFGCFRVSPTTGLIGQSSNRHLHEQQGGMSLDELASNGSYIPRPEFSRNGK